MNSFDPAATLSWTIMLGLLGFSIWRLQKSQKKQAQRKRPKLF